MEVLEAIRDRRSVRAYTGGVSRAEIDALLHLAVQAPSAMNSQPWAFAVVEDRALLQRISERAKAHLLRIAAADPKIAHYRDRLADPAFDIFYGAPALIVICADRGWPNAFADCYLAGENLLLAAHAMGLATCCIGFAQPYLNEAEARAELSIPDGFQVALPVIVGRPAGKVSPVSRRAPRILSWRH
jgi:nitroreductase